MGETTLIQAYHPRSIGDTGFTFGVVHNKGLEKVILTQVHHYSNIRSRLAPQILCALLILPLPPPELLATTENFTVPKVLPFPECYMVGIIWYAAFSD